MGPIGQIGRMDLEQLNEASVWRRDISLVSDCIHALRDRPGREQFVSSRCSLAPEPWQRGVGSLGHQTGTANLTHGSQSAFTTTLTVKDSCACPLYMPRVVCPLYFSGLFASSQ